MKGPSSRWSNRWLAALLTIAAGLSISFAAIAQEFEKVPDGSREQIPATPFVGVAYGFIWIALLVYLLSIARGLSRVRKDLGDLRRRLDRGETNAPTPR